MSTFESPDRRTRRSVLAGLLTVPFTGLANGCAPIGANEDETPDARIAIVYRGPAGCAGCSETLAERLSQSPVGMDVAFIGPHEELPLKASALSGVALYAQPGGETIFAPLSRASLPGFIRGVVTSLPPAVATSASAWVHILQAARDSAF